MDNVANELQDYTEMWILPNTVLAFKVFPNKEELDKVREVLDSLEKML